MCGLLPLLKRAGWEQALEKLPRCRIQISFILHFIVAAYLDGDRKPQIGDIVYSRNVTVGAASLVDVDEKFALGQDVCLLRSKQNNGSFFVHQLRANVVIAQLNQVLIGSTFNRINISQIKKLIVCVPPISEQRFVDEYINEVENQIDVVIKRIKKEQQVLRELSNVIISDTVTGKLKV